MVSVVLVVLTMTLIKTVKPRIASEVNYMHVTRRLDLHKCTQVITWSTGSVFISGILSQLLRSQQDLH